MSQIMICMTELQMIQELLDQSKHFFISSW